MVREKLPSSKRDLLELFAAPSYYGLFVVTIPLIMLYALGAASNTQNLLKFFVYGITGLTGVLVVMARIIVEAMGYLDDKEELEGFRYLTIHSPEQTYLGQAFPWMRGVIPMLSISLIAASLFGALVRFSGQFFSAAPVFFKQGSVIEGTSSLVLAVYPAVPSETLLAHVFIQQGSLAGFIYVLRSNGVSKKGSVIISKILSVIVGTLGFFSLHLLRYGNSEAGQFSSLLLGFIDSVAMALTHSVIPLELIHGTGNAFYQATVAGVLSADVSGLILMGMMVLGSVGLWWSWMNSR